MTALEGTPRQPLQPATKPARAHHYVPRFYLAGFTLPGDQQGRLLVLDREQEKVWESTPEKSAHQRDFYRVEFEGVEPDAVEKILGKFEGQAAGAFRRIQETRKLPEGEDLATLLNFVALQATRVPQFRGIYEGNAAYLVKAQLKFALSHPEHFEQLLEDMRSEGREVPDLITREGLLEFLEDESRYTIDVPREASIKNMVEMAKGLLPVLDQRIWSLVLATDDSDDFVCSDRPVLLVPTKPNPPPFLGFGMTDTEVIMPLNRRMTLVGHYEGESQVFEADRLVVGLFNQRMLDYAERFVYSAREFFPVTVPKEDTDASAL